MLYEVITGKGSDHPKRARGLCLGSGTAALVSKFRVAGRAGKGNHIADVANAGQEHEQALEAQAEPRITSYNVCYTKLLRRSLWTDRPPTTKAGIRDRFVL